VEIFSQNFEYNSNRKDENEPPTLSEFSVSSAQADPRPTKSKITIEKRIVNSSSL